MSETSPNKYHTHQSPSDTCEQEALLAQRFALLHQAALSIGSNLDLDGVVRNLLDATQSFLAETSWSVWLLNETGDTLTCWQAQDPEGRTLLCDYQVPLGHGIEGWSARENAFVYVKDLCVDPRNDPRIAKLAQMQAGSLICTPLNIRSTDNTGQTTIGVLSVVRRETDAFDEDDFELVNALAEAAAIAIQNARLYKSSQHEIERRKLVEGALRESESHYRTLVETSPDSILLLSLSGDILMCNHRTLALHNYEHATQLLGKNYLRLIAPEVRPEAIDFLGRVLQGDSPREYELTLMRSDGSPFAGEIVATLTANSYGEPASIVAFTRDISRRKETEAAIQRHNLELLVLNDIATRTSQCHSLRQLLGIALDRTLDALDIDTGWAMLLDPVSDDRRHADISVFRGLLARPEIVEQSQDFLHHLVERVRGARQPVILQSVELFELYAGTSAPCQIVAVPLQVQDRVIGTMVAAGLNHRHPRSISFRQIQLLATIGHQISVAVANLRLTQEAAELDVLRKLDQMRADLIANFSHDLRSPLGLIKMTSSTLLRDDVVLDATTQKEFLKDIIAQTDHLTRLVDGVLDLGKLESGHLVLDRIPMDLSALTQQLFDAAIQRYANHQFTLDLPQDPLMVIADSVRIDQVLHNLLSNALKYSPGGGPISIRAWRKCRKVLLSISDAGIGIPEDQLDMIFERFYRVKDEATEHISGAGLGLTTCKGIVEAHGGKIWVSSTLGAGSTFTFALPAAPNTSEK